MNVQLHKKTYISSLILCLLDRFQLLWSTAISGYVQEQPTAIKPLNIH